MIEDDAPPDYEPTPEEAAETFGWFDDADPGHGIIQMVPALEKWMASAEHVWWRNRQELEDGRVSWEWMIPKKLPH